MQKRLISPRSILLAAAVALFISPAFADAEFKLPPPPQYKELGGDPLKSLVHYKAIWLKDKISAEKSFLNSLKRKKEIPEIDIKSVDADIKKYEDDIKQDQQDLDAVGDPKAVDPTNPKARANTKIVKDNVEKWIAALNKQADSKDATEEEKRQAAANRTNLANALKDAEEKNERLFR